MDQRTGAKSHLRNLYNPAFGVSLRCIRSFPGRAWKQNRLSIHLKNGITLTSINLQRKRARRR